MKPVNGGSYCGNCCKVVVDFSECTNEEIVNYFSANTGKKTCGRFLRSQVDRPKYQNRLLRFILAVVFVFGGFLFSSCGSSRNEEYITGDSIYIPDSARRAMEEQMKADSIHNAGFADSSNKSHQPK